MDTTLMSLSQVQAKPFEKLEARTIAYHLLIELLAQVVLL
jgi:hypothetical protein